MQPEAPQLTTEMVQAFLAELVRMQAIAEQEAAQLIAEFMAGSPERILALAQQYLQDRNAPVNPKMVSYVFWGGPIKVNFYLVDRLLTPLGFDGLIARLCAVTIVAIVGMSGLNDVFPPASNSIAISEVQ